jgi:hypothetical protein
MNRNCSLGGTSEERGQSFEHDPPGREVGLARRTRGLGSRAFQPLFDGQRDRIAGLDHLMIQPHPQTVPLEPLRQLSHRRLVRTGVTEENVVLRLLACDRPFTLNLLYFHRN